MEGYVVVLQPDAPQILLSGTAHFAHPASDFEAPDGVPLFPNLQITCSISHQVEAKKDENWHGTGEWSTERSRDKMERPASCHSAVEGELIVVLETGEESLQIQKQDIVC